MQKIFRTLNGTFMPFVAGAAALCGGAVLVSNVTRYTIPRLLSEGIAPSDAGRQAASFWTEFTGSSAPAFLLVALASGIWTLFTLEPYPDHLDDRSRSTKFFTGYLIGLGYFLLVDAILTMVAIAGLALGGHLDEVLHLSINEANPTNATDAHTKNVIDAVILALSLAMTLLGALFYFANSLWAKFRAGIIFDRNIFWGGLWFRLAEAVVFTLAIFLALRYSKSQTQQALHLMPVLGLFIGMTVKSSEALVFGLVERFLAAAVALVQPPGDKPPKDEKKKARRGEEPAADEGAG